MENTKFCKKCGRELPLECFGKDKRSKDGLQSYCKECHKQYYAEHAEAKKKYSKHYYADNAGYYKQYRADNAEHKKQYNKQYYVDNAEARKQYMKHRYGTIEGYARQIRRNNLRDDRNQCRIGAEEDPLPTIEEYIHLLSQPDFYDGKQYHWSEMGLDRIDNSKPHTIDNVVPCSTAHNRQRGRRSFEEFCEQQRKKIIQKQFNMDIEQRIFQQPREK